MLFNLFPRTFFLFLKSPENEVEWCRDHVTPVSLCLRQHYNGIMSSSHMLAGDWLKNHLALRCLIGLVIYTIYIKVQNF